MRGRWDAHGGRRTERNPASPSRAELGPPRPGEAMSPVSRTTPVRSIPVPRRSPRRWQGQTLRSRSRRASSRTVWARLRTSHRRTRAPSATTRRPRGHQVLAALSLIDQVEPTASLTPAHEALARLADPDHVTAAAAGEADGLGLPPRRHAGPG